MRGRLDTWLLTPMDFAKLGQKRVAEIEKIQEEAAEGGYFILIFALGNPDTGKINSVLYTTAPDLPEVIA